MTIWMKVHMYCDTMVVLGCQNVYHFIFRFCVFFPPISFWLFRYIVKFTVGTIADLLFAPFKYCFMMSKLEAGQVKLQSRLEEEEEAKAALMGRIQRLTKLILVSTKNAMPATISERPGHRRRHSFGEDEVCDLVLVAVWMTGWCFQ